MPTHGSLKRVRMSSSFLFLIKYASLLPHGFLKKSFLYVTFLATPAISDRVRPQLWINFYLTFDHQNCSHNYLWRGSSDDLGLPNHHMKSGFPTDMPRVLTDSNCVDFVLIGFRKYPIQFVPEDLGSVQGGVRVEVCGTDDKAMITVEMRDGNDSRGLQAKALLPQSCFKLPQNICAASSLPRTQNPAGRHDTGGKYL